MLTILVLFVGLTLATAVIAYWSDNLGKKLGKKRVSLWGMRPRTTATFLTIASSWLIMVFTLGVMLGLFKPLRQALLRYDEVKANESTLSKSAKKLTGQVGALNGQVETLTTRFDEASNQLKQVSGELKKSSQAAKDARKEQQVAEKQADVARKSADTFRKSEQAAVKREQEARKNLGIVTSQRNATEQERRAAQGELKAAQNDLKSASAQVKTANNRVKTANYRVKLAQANLGVVQASLGPARENETIAKNNTRLAQNLAADANDKRKLADKEFLQALDASEKAKAKAREAQEKVDELEQQGQRLLDANARLYEENRVVGSERDIVLGNDIRVPVGFTLVARTFEQGVSFSEATRRLHDIFETGKEVIAPGTNKPALLPGAELRLATQEEPLAKANASDPDISVVVNEDGIYNNLADAISRSQTPLSVRLVSNSNHLEGQKYLYTRFIIVPVRPALAAGFELASTTFNEEMSDARLFSALLKLVEAGRRVAVQNGVTPPLAPDSPDSPDAPDSRDFYAPGSKERIFETLRKVSAQGGRARVRIITDKAISTVDQLSVRFEVAPLAPATGNATTKVTAARKSSASSQ